MRMPPLSISLVLALRGLDAELVALGQAATAWLESRVFVLPEMTAAAAAAATGGPTSRWKRKGRETNW